MFRLLIVALALVGLLFIFGAFDKSVKQQLASSESFVRHTQKELLNELKALDDSDASKTVGEWSKLVPTPSPRDLLELRAMVDKIQADPKAASRYMAELKAKYAELCKDTIQPHLPQDVRCTPQ